MLEEHKGKLGCVSPTGRLIQNKAKIEWSKYNKLLITKTRGNLNLCCLPLLCSVWDISFIFLFIQSVFFISSPAVTHKDCNLWFCLGCTLNPHTKIYDCLLNRTTRKKGNNERKDFWAAAAAAKKKNAQWTWSAVDDKWKHTSSCVKRNLGAEWVLRSVCNGWNTTPALVHAAESDTGIVLLAVMLGMAHGDLQSNEYSHIS